MTEVFCVMRKQKWAEKSHYSYILLDLIKWYFKKKNTGGVDGQIYGLLKV